LWFVMGGRSKPKEAVLRILRGATSPPTADWSYTMMKEEIPNISLGTVYRNLKLPEQEGEILD